MIDGLNGTGEYTFGEFIYRSSDNTLRRNGVTLPLTPKALDLLRTFIANPGKLLSKDQLMNELWPDSFVEESNLAVTVRRLRKALEDDAHKPAYIETVARQGYRFVAVVGRSGGHATEQATSDNPVGRSFRYLIPLAVAAGLLIASISLGSLYLNSGSTKAAPILAAPFALQRLSTSGQVTSAAISSDGDKVVYTVRNGSREAVWLQELSSKNNVEIIPPTDEDYYELAFSPDGTNLYFTRGPRLAGDPADIYRVSIFGGIPKKIVQDTRGWISISPDGGLISFVRCEYENDDHCSLWMAETGDGKNERMLTSRPRPHRIGDNEISPDGRSIVFAVGQSENAATDFELISLDLETGREREISNEKFFDIKSLEILPDRSGILLTASRTSTQRYQVWKMDYADGVARPLTQDSAAYVSISLDDSGSRLIATQLTNSFRLVRSDLNQPNQTKTLVQPAWAFSSDPDGSFVFQSDSTGDLEIWRMGEDGTSQRQLTNSPGNDTHPIVARGSHDLFFCSNRSGQMHVWRMKADGSDQTQITKINGGIPMYADTQWVYYTHGLDRTLWRVSVTTGVEELVMNKAPGRGRFVFSPGGDLVAYIDLRDGKPVMVIDSIPDGAELRSATLDDTGRIELAWVPDESAVAYSISQPDGTNTLWIQPMDGSERYRSADLGEDQVIYLSFLTEKDSIAYVQGRWEHDFVMLTGFQ